HRVNVVIEEFETGLVEAAREPFLGDGHSDGGRDPLSERTSGGLDTGHPTVLWMARRLAAELTEAADVIERDRWFTESLIVGIDCLDSSEMKDGPEQHRGMAVRKNKPIAVGPDRVLRIVVHCPVPQRIDEWCQRHRRSGMAGLGLLHCIHRESSNRVDREL